MSRVEGNGIEGVYAVGVVDEMRAFDRLGPKTKHALNYSVFKFSAKFLIEWANYNYVSPESKDGDAMIATSIYQEDQEMTLHPR